MNLLNPKFSQIFIALIFALLLTPFYALSQNDNPCDCTQRWEEGAHWNSDGSINDAPNAPSENGIIRCGSSAETQSQVGPLANCTYDSASFAIDISSFPCVEPSSGNIVFPLNPTNGQPIIWLNFDVRPDAGSFQIQINDNSGDNVAWALYYSNTITYGVNPNPNGLGVDSISGSCSSLTLAACGVESSSTWNTLPVPNFGVATNYYIAIWDQDADGNVQVNNFKARFGCGDADILLCNVSADTPIAQCDANGTYTLKIPVSGINGEFYAYDPNSNNANGLSSSVCLTNPGANPAVTSDTLILTYNQGIAYNAIIFEATDTLPGISVPNGSCPDPLNPEGCKDTIAGPAPNCCLLVASTNTFNSDCNGADNASILAIGTGGAAPLTYAWSDGQTVAQAMNLSPGTYTVTITDANQCTSTATGSVSEPPALSVLCIVGPNGNISCNGGSDGAISSINTGGTLPYSYQWKDSTGAPIGVNLPIISGLTAGAYTLVVTDGNGCKDSCSVTLTEPTVLTCNIVGEDPDCNGASTGSATVTVGGGTPGYAYLWSDNQTTQIATGLIAGTYTVTVTDANNCTKECTVTLGEPSALSCSAQGTDPLCNGGNDGSAIVTGAGGTQGYTYMWSDNQTTQTATGLTAGTYTATITDANQCTSTCTVVIGEPTAIQTSLTPTSSTCGFANGAVSSNVSGGTPNYTYAWSTGASTANISGVSAGAYSLIVTDANGCKDTMSTSVNDIGGPSVTGSATMVTCNGGHDGTATATAIGGTAGYTYLWSDNQSTQTAIGLFAGTYTVTVTDANQCMASTTIVVNEPSALSCATQGTDPLCNGGNDGSATVTGSGGISPYTYSWSNGQTGSSASGLIAGTYTVVVIDANNCTSTCTVTLGEPSALSCSTQGTDPLCNGGNDGSATVTGAGGTTGYTYMWSDNQTTQTATGLIAGTYTATVTDANQCTSTCTVVIGEPSVLSCSTQGTDPLCNGGNDGSATVAGSGGTSPYAYAWSNGQTGASASGLTAGTFTATVTDANNCTSTCTVTLGEPSAILTTLTPTNSTCGFANGAVSSNVSGGTPNYTYAWSTGATTSNISGVSAGAYSLIVTDANGCKDTMSTSVNDIGGPSVTASGTNLLCNGDSSGTATANPTGGTLGYSYMWSDGQSTQTATGLDAGTYTVTVFDANQCQASTSVTITEPGELMASCSVLNPILCFGDGNGAVVASATGGTPPYCFDWGLSIGNCSDSLENLGAGNYGVLITDANGCTATCTVTLGEPSLLSCSTQGVDPLCNGGDDGSATAFAFGGLGGGNQPIGGPSTVYTYMWSDGQTSSTAIGLSAGTYTVTVSDANSCTSTCTVILGEPTAIQISLAPINSTCGFANGAVSATVNGGTPGYTYEWSNGASTQNVNGLLSGIYTLVVTDANGCKDSSTAFVGDVGGPSVSATGSNPLCNGDSTGTVTAFATGGTPGYSYVWSDGQSTQSAIGLPAGTYTVTVFDANQCQASTSVTIVDPPVLSCTVTGTNPLCYDGADGTALAVATGGSDGAVPVIAGLTYYYNWSNGQTNALATGLSAGTYTVTVSDDNQCTSTCSVTLAEPPEMILTKTDTFCFIEFGLDAYQHGEELTSISAGDVTVTITADANQQKPDNVIVFNSDLSGTPDADLEVDLGNLMILPDNMTDANGDFIVDVPNDNQFGGTITLDFSDNVKVVSFKFVDEDDPAPSYARAYDAANNLISTVVINNGGNGSVQVIAMNADNVRKLEFELGGSGGIADLQLECPSSVGQASTGSIDLTVNGGTPGYSYVWSNGASTQDISNVPAGFYTVTVTDANNCSKTCSTLLSSPNQPIASCQVTRELVCNGDTDAEITATVIGGQAPYSILWSTGATSNTITNCTAGAYALTITDANGFVFSESMILGEPEVIDNSVSAPGGTTICYGSSALLETVNEPGCTYQWFKYNNPIPGATNSSIIVSAKAKYKVEITNQTGCIRTSPFITIDKFQNPTAVITSGGSTSFCPGKSLMLTANTAAGYTYEWKRRGKVVSTSNNTYEAVKPGKHKVVVTDANGCVKASNIIDVTRYPRPNVVLDELGPVDICQGSSITLNAVPSVGPAPYTYKWYRFSNEIPGATSSNYNTSLWGGYKVRIEDANGCSDKSGKTNVNLINCAPRTLSPKLNVSIYPNPFTHEININILGKEDQSLRVAIYNVLGNVVYEKDIADIYSLDRINLGGVESGMYLLEVRQGDEVQHVKINKLK